MLRTPSALMATFVAVLALLTGCAGRAGTPGTDPAALRVTPSDATLAPGGQVQFTAFAVGGERVPLVWSVDGGAANGTVTPGGLYTAPRRAGTFRVRVRFTDRRTPSAEAQVSVVDGVSFRVEPTEVTAVPFSRVDFDPVVTGISDAVRWSISGGGRIDGDGLFQIGADEGTFTVTATSVADPTRTARAVVRVSKRTVARFEFEGKGTVTLRLFADEAPRTVANLVSLINEGYYDGIIVHRYEVGFVTQWGDPLTKFLPLTDSRIGTGGPGYSIRFERNTLKNVRFNVAMALSTPRSNTGGSQLFINLKDNPTLDGDYSVFAQVVGGRDVALRLRKGDEIKRAFVFIP